MDAELWERVGLYVPLIPGSMERLALLEYMTKSCATIEQIVDVRMMWTLSGVAGTW